MTKLLVYKRIEMRSNRWMRPKLREHFESELQQARQAIAGTDNSLVWNGLARAHILGQFDVGPHLRVHIWMFLFALKTLNTREIFGQIPRLLLAAPGSLFKKAPRGNTGLSDVGIFQPMNIPEDLQSILNEK